MTDLTPKQARRQRKKDKKARSERLRGPSMLDQMAAYMEAKRDFAKCAKCGHYRLHHKHYPAIGLTVCP